MKKFLAAGVGLAAIGVIGIVYAQAPIPTGPQVLPIPQVTAIGPTDLFADVVGGQPSAQTSFASGLQIANYAGSVPGGNADNVLVGGDATTNLFQRATTGSSVTTTVTYGGPDRWAYWSGTSTAMTVSRDSTAGDLPANFKYAFKMARTSGQTGVVQVCMMQEVESANSYGFQGQTAELDFHAVTGSNFSPTNGNIQAYIITGTGTDEGVAGTTSGAFGLNAGGGGSGGWTGQVNWAATIAAGVGSNGRYTIAAPIPATATEIGVAICFTPVGTAGTNDYVALSGIQLTRNSALTSVVSANASGTATALSPNDTRAKSFVRRAQAYETLLQYRYHWQTSDPAATVEIPSSCFVTAANTTVKCGVWLPVDMRTTAATTVSVSTSFGIVVTAGTAGTCSTLAATTSSNSVRSIGVTCTTAGTIALGSATPLIGAATLGVLQADAEL